MLTGPKISTSIFRIDIIWSIKRDAHVRYCVISKGQSFPLVLSFGFTFGKSHTLSSQNMRRPPPRGYRVVVSNGASKFMQMIKMIRAGQRQQ